MNSNTNNEIILKVTNLYKNFGSLEVLKGINLEVKKGEVISIIGSSGSGKSTFIRCLNLLGNPTAGKIEFENQVIFEYLFTPWDFCILVEIILISRECFVYYLHLS